MKQLKRNYSCILVLILTLAKLAGYGQTFAVNDNGININNTAINWVVARGMTAPPRWTIPVNNPSYNSSNGFVTAIATNFLSYQNGGNCYNSNGIWYPITNNPPNGWAPDDSTPVFFRLAFNLPNGTITNCHLHFFIDDSLALYINGSFVAAQYHAVADFSQNQIGSLFRCGDNVIAILGKNSQTPCYMLNFDVYSDSYITIDTTQHINLNFNLPPDTMFCNGHGSVSLHVPIVTDYYHWNTGDSTSGIIVTNSGTYIVTASDGANCSATASTTIGFDSLHISATHVDAGCGTSTGSASVQVLSGTGPYRYLWNTGDSINSITNVAGGAYRVTITDALGCSSVNIITISGLGATSVAITGPTNTICAPDTATLCATSGFTSYHWNNGDTTICINTTAAGNYYVTVTDNSGCTAESNHIPVNFYPVPPVSITVNGDTMRVYNGNTFQWYLNGVAIPNATSNVYIATVPGNYQVRITDSNNCGALSSPVQLLLGVDDITSDKFSVFPNPLLSGSWQLNVNDNLLGSLAEVFDAAGRIVFKSQIKAGHSEINLDVAKGVYLLRITSTDGIFAKKLVKL